MASLFPPPASSGLPPNARSILIQGSFPVSAIIHFATSSLAELGEDSKAIFISPSKERFQNTLIQFNDKWLNDNAGKIALIPLLERITNFYPSNIRLCSILLASLTTQSQATTPSRKTAFNSDLALIVLHEVSNYFLPQCSNSTVSSYIQIVSQAFDTANYLSKSTRQPVRVALFDSHLDELELPIVRVPEQDAPEEPDIELPPSSAVAQAVQKYFHWYGNVQEHKGLNPLDLSNDFKSLCLFSNDANTHESEVELKWIEEVVEPRPWTEQMQMNLISINN